MRVGHPSFTLQLPPQEVYLTTHICPIPYSFDPLPDKVILWTRITVPPAARQSTVSVAWEVATGADFRDALVAAGSTSTCQERDFTVQVDVDGLKPGTRYVYRFFWEGVASAIGHTKTAAAGPLEELRFALVSCANWGFGYFHVYDLATKLDDLDFVLHAGDYM